MNCKECGQVLDSKAEVRREKKNVEAAAKRVNNALYKLGQTYHDYIPVFQIDTILVENGFNASSTTDEPVIDTLKIHEEVGHGKYLSATFYKMKSGRIEVTAYLN